MMLSTTVQNIITLLTKINLYIPFIVISVLSYSMANIIVTGIMISAWRIVTYYKCLFIYNMLLSPILKAFITLFLLLISIFNFYDNYLATLVIVILYSIISTYFSINTLNAKINRYVSFSLILLGMIISGMLLNNIIILNIYFSVITIYLMFAGRLENVNKYKTLNLKKAKNVNACTVFIHNFHYYMIMIYLPIISLKLFGSIYFVGLIIFLNWILFLFKDNFYRKSNEFLSEYMIIALGFIFTGIFLFIILLVDNLVITLLVLTLQGISGGVSEKIFCLEDISKHSHEYWHIWKLGGILGAPLGGILGYFTNLQFVFVIASLLSFFVGVINLLRKNSEGE